MTSPPNDTCDPVPITIIHNSYILHSSEFFAFITSLIAIPISIWSLQKCIRFTRFHINFRLLGAIHCICLLVHCFGRLIQNGSALYLWLGDLPICERRQHFGICLIARLMYIFGLFSSSFTSVFMCVERSIATKFYEKYEKKKWHLGVFLVVFQAFLSSLITLGFYYNSYLADRPVFCFFDIQREWALITEFLMICSNVMGFWQCSRLNRINKEIRNHQNTIALSQKYQVEENKMLIKVMNQFTVMDFIFMIFFFSLGGLQHLIRPYIPISVFFAAYELIHCVPLYTIIVLILMTKIIRSMRVQQSKDIIKVVQTKDDAYFQYLRKEWQ